MIGIYRECGFGEMEFEKLISKLGFGLYQFHEKLGRAGSEWVCLIVSRKKKTFKKKNLKITGPAATREKLFVEEDRVSAWHVDMA